MILDTPKHGGVKTLMYIPQLVAMDCNDPTTTHHFRYLQWAILGVREINMWAINNVKVAYIPMNVNKSITLPMDYVKYTKIGLCMGDGDCSRVISLGLNNDLCLPREKDDCGDDIINAVANTITDEAIAGYFPTFYSFVDHYHNGQYVAGVYGLGGGFHDHYYREDKQMNTIQFDSEVPGGTIVLEYISTGIEPSGNTLIPVIAVETLRSWTHWQRIENRKDYSRNEKDSKRDLFTSNLRNLKRFDNLLNMDEFLDLTRQNIHQLPKR